MELLTEVHNYTMKQLSYLTLLLKLEKNSKLEPNIQRERILGV